MLSIRFVNDKSGDKNIGNYSVGVFVNDTRIWAGRIVGHKRESGWRGLVNKLVEVMHNPDRFEKYWKMVEEERKART